MVLEIEIVFAGRDWLGKGMKEFSGVMEMFLMWVWFAWVYAFVRLIGLYT